MFYVNGIKNIITSSRYGKIIWEYIRELYIKYICLTPCKRLQKYGTAAIREIHTSLSTHDLPYVADFGTLLGIVREKGFITHDDDIDFTIPPNSPSPKEYMKILNKNKRLKFCWGFEYKDKITELTYLYKGIPIDFFFSCVEDGNIYDYVYMYTEGLVDWIPYRRQRILNGKYITGSINGQDIIIPDNFEDILKTTYGDWRHPVDYHTTGQSYVVSNGLPSERMDGIARKVNEFRIYEIG